MARLLKLIGLVSIFVFMVGCCAKTIPHLKIDRDIPIDPGSVLFIGGVNAMSGEQMSGTGIIVESNDEESWALSAGHVCYPEHHDQLIMWTDLWMHMGFDIRGRYEPIFMIALDQVNDVCVFRIPLGNLPALSLIHI